ncbi:MULTISPECIES: HAD family hydrolase [Streptomyces]|uniref:HAD family hydrolase n=1 Tax=Streptomyces TaxID=1883 RepID=UPI00140D049D|nr:MULTISPECIES: HAD family hydrolase [Streptomyces]MDH6226320.1 phosphoglycolate phosphatase [Streptomyces sp. MJP52]
MAPHVMTAEADRLVSRARVVLLALEGPLCRLFPPGGEERRALADDLLGLAARLGGQDAVGRLPDAGRAGRDPHAVLAAVAEGPDTALAAALRERLTAAELRAVPKAAPTPWADPLVRTWAALGVRTAVVTRHAAEAASRYVAGRGLAGALPRVCGRGTGHPDEFGHTLAGALASLGATREEALFVGETPGHLAAARAAGIPFLGHARSEAGERQLLEAGAQHLVGSLKFVLDALTATSGRTSVAPC